jgi:hypothetical protein
MEGSLTVTCLTAKVGGNSNGVMRPLVVRCQFGVIWIGTESALKSCKSVPLYRRAPRPRRQIAY